MKQNHKDKITDDQLIKCFEEEPHLGKMKSKLGLPEVTIWRRLKSLGLHCASKGGSSIDLKEILEGKHPYYQTFKLNKRLVKEKILEYKCSCCGISEWNNKPITLQLDHINGNNSDHRLENLRLICPNCHSQTDTYCGKNKEKES